MEYSKSLVKLKDHFSQDKEITSEMNNKYSYQSCLDLFIIYDSNLDDLGSTGRPSALLISFPI